MKKFWAFLALAAAMSATSYAQDDDVYFVPSRQKENTVQEKNSLRSGYEPIENGTDAGSDSNWAAGRGNNGWDVDAYNRRTSAYGSGATPADTAMAESYDLADDSDGLYTTRLVRFHSPTFGIYVSSPYYALVTDYYWADPWLRPWGYDYWYGSWYGWGWSPFYYGSYWGSPWWHSHWWDYGWAWHPVGPGHGPAWNPRPGRPRYWSSGSGYRPSRDYASNRYGTTSRPSSRRYTTTGSNGGRYNSAATRPSRTFGNSSRSWGSGNNASNTSRPSRNYSTTTPRSKRSGPR